MFNERDPLKLAPFVQRIPGGWLDPGNKSRDDNKAEFGKVEIPQEAFIAALKMAELKRALCLRFVAHKD